MRSALLLVLCLFRFAPVDAVSPVIWEQNTQDTFGKGEAVSVSITRDGEVQLGPMMTEFADTGEEFVWSLAKGADGTVYAGTGGEGRVYRLSEGASELLFDSPERAIFALSAAQNGTVYAGSSPGGLVYAIPGKGEPRTLARTEDQHVWVLIDDGKGGLYAGTGGGTGRVVRISKSGEVEEVLVASDPNVTSLVRADDGTLYAGTDQNGLIYRVDPSGKVDVLYDASENEIKALAIAGDGSLLAGAMNSARPTPSRGAAGPNARNSGNAPKNGQSVVYSIQTSGSGWRLWDVPAPSVQALSVSPDGSVIVVTGGKGRVYRLFADGSHSVITTVEDAEPWTFESDGKGGGWIASSGSGQVSRLGGTLAREGHLTSEPEDFSLITKWGRVAWEGDASSGTGVAFKVRAGNSEVPDETWGAWTDVSSGPISVRAGRYIQYRMDLSGDGKKTPSVREVMVSGLPENVRPMILDLGISGPHEERAQGGPGGKNGGGRRQSPPPSEDGDGWTISWTGADVNDDPLIYTLHFKGRQERAWKLLAEEVTGNSYSWDTESAPEGDVQVRLTVSDSPANPETHALTSERISAPFKIDHTEPEVRIASVDANANGVTVTGSIVDATSYVKSAAYSLNSGPWKVVFPSDDVFDSGEESLTLTLNGLTAGEYTLVIRASDSRGNVGVAKHVFDVK